jgi:hypothetical protein
LPVFGIFHKKTLQPKRLVQSNLLTLKGQIKPDFQIQEIGDMGRCLLVECQMVSEADPGFLERGVQSLKKGTHGGGAHGGGAHGRDASPLTSAEPPQKHFKIQVLICVFLASGNKIPRLSWLQKKHFFFWGTFLVLCNERVPFLGKIWVLCN